MFRFSFQQTTLSFFQGSAPFMMLLAQRNAFAHGGEDHSREDHGASTKTQVKRTEPTTAIQPENKSSDLRNAPQKAPHISLPGKVRIETNVVPLENNSLLAQLPIMGLSESLFGLILLAPFGLIWLRYQVQRNLLSSQMPSRLR